MKHLVDVTAAVLLVGLSIGALTPTLRLATGYPTRGRGRHYTVWATLIGALLGLAFVYVHENSIIRFDRQRLTLTTLEPTVVLGLILIGLLFAGMRYTMRALKTDPRLLTNPVPRPLRYATAITGCVWIVLAVFRDSQRVYMQTLTLVPATSSVFSSDTFFNTLFFLLGLLLVVACGAGVAKLVRSAPQYAAWVSTALIVVTSATHIFLIVRLLNSIRAIYLPQATVTFLLWLVNNEKLFVFAALLVCAVLALVILFKAFTADKRGPNAAARRIKRAESKTYTRRSALTLAAFSASVLTLTAGAKYAYKEVQLSPPEPFDVKDGHAVIPLSAVDDGHLHRFEYTTKGHVPVRFIVIQKAGSSYGIGLDACEICGATGYYEKDDKVICKLCEVAMNIATIGFKGGCNPIPIEYEIASGQITIPTSVLEDSEKIFA
ncbi:Fe-S-containing protein [Gleimia hominis]|uniref:Fe-S-containing protein n=1 Tax=Gleimia hominis TaxID=595468 RepID=A0ABU3IA32_9ACTO|nr:Fe-S-containing protein [Gleimia hominis]MDT3767228.1 Fe-S-containing protein [Gleimia hominis]